MNIKSKLLQKILFPSQWVNHTQLRNRLQNKTILITGASYGIGEKTAQQLALQGVTLILVARTLEKLQLLKHDLEKKGAVVYIFSCNLYQEEETERIIHEIKDLNLSIDIFINNAGKSIHRSIQDSENRFHDFTRTIHLNYLAPVHLSLGFLSSLKQNQGQIINLSAINVLFAPVSGWAAYQASKMAIDQWMRCATPELKSFGICISNIYLPLVRTKMIEPTKAYEKAPAMNPEDVAKIVANTIINRKRKWTPWWTFFPRIFSYSFRPLWESVSTYYINRK